MRKPTTLLVLSYLLFYLCNQGSLLLTLGQAKTNVHIVYLGERQNDDPEHTRSSHHHMLTNILGSKEAASESMVYSYRHGFSGFAAKLSHSQAQTLAELPGVVGVIPNSNHKLHTTRSWDYLGLASHATPGPSNLLQKTNMGDGVIIGVMDSGFWPESRVFNEEGVGPIPSRWKGTCESSERFNSTLHCNKKVIGARWYIRGLLANSGPTLNLSDYTEYLSPRDAAGHGTHVSSTALGSRVANISYRGLGAGTVRGGAPRARLAMYKACWNLNGVICASADILKAFDDAIHDGVDIMSLSIGSFPQRPETDSSNTIAIGSFHAVSKGITVVCASGNDGPMAKTITNAVPWIITVAASTMDRTFPTPITLGNNKTILGLAKFTGNETGFTGLLYSADSRICENLAYNEDNLKGKVVFCFALNPTTSPYYVTSDIISAGGAGVIIATNPTDLITPCDGNPCISIDYEDGEQILNYIYTTSSPVVKLGRSTTHVGRPDSAKIARFSSRGPNPMAPAILKPDIAAPGTDIIAATSPHDFFQNNGYTIMSGTSMATPHVSGIVALLKANHPDWSPAAIKSALVTTARNTDQDGYPIFAEASPRKIADPFDLGGGIVNPNQAANPGLVYDMGRPDYIQYLCAMGYNSSGISLVTKQKQTLCPNTMPSSILDVNLPSIVVPSLRNSVTITRTVTNVGPVNSVYRAKIENPFGVILSVRPDILVFDSRTKKKKFIITISQANHISREYFFGSLTWSDGVHMVRSPVCVRAETIQFYTDNN